jgi:hypothetical protein
VKLKRIAPNRPHHGEGEHGTQRRKGGLMGVGEHLPQRRNVGNSDARGYQQSASRQMGAHKGPLKEGDTRRRQGPEGLSKGSPPPSVTARKGVRGNPDSHMGDAGRGGTGRHGKGDSFKGKPTALSESPTHSWFESLGASK